jgi:hypothetical protein
MNRQLTVTSLGIVAGGAAFWLLFSGCSLRSGGIARSELFVKVEKTAYHGWRDALRISNGEAFAVIVPSIGRVMQFGFEGTEGVFWQNAFLDGKGFDPKADEWINFGGDKTWPAPEGEWSNYTHHKSWKPPLGFDGVPYQGTVEGSDVILESTVDPSYGIKSRRRIHLDHNQPVMTISTTYLRQGGPPSKVGIWVITQLKDPERIFIKLPADRQRRNLLEPLSPKSPAGLKETDGFLSLTRDKSDPSKIGTEASSLLWVGAKEMLLIDSPRLRGFEYPDRGSSAEVYTNPDPLKYIELEMVGPLQLLEPGAQMERTSMYRLYHRTEATPEAEVRKVFRGRQ